MAAISTILGAMVIAGGLGYAGYAAGGGGGGKKKGPAPLAMPAAPNVADAAAIASAGVRSKKRAAARSRTTFTSPLGIGGQADVIKKTLTGQ